MPTDSTVTLQRQAVQQNAQLTGALSNGVTSTSALVQFPGAPAGFVIPSETERGTLTQVPVTQASICVATPLYPAQINSDLPPPADPLNPFDDPAITVVGKGLGFWAMSVVDAWPPAETGPPPDNTPDWYAWSDGVMKLEYFRGELEIYLEASGVETDRNGVVVVFGVQTSLNGINWTLVTPLLARRLFTTQSAPSPVHYSTTLQHVRTTRYRVVIAREQAAPATMAMIATDARITFSLRITEPY